MTAIYMTRVPSGLTPSDQYQWDELFGDRIKMGDEVRCEIKKPRNVRYHRKYFAMLNAAFDMQDAFTNRDHWRDAVQIAAGHCETYVTHDGKVNYRPKSISFAQCDETEFERVYNQALTAICEHWVKTDAEQLATILEFG